MIPVAVTSFPVPTVAVSKLALAALHVTCPVSPLTTPLRVQVPIDAVVVRSYALFDAVTDGVSETAVIFAVVVADVLDSV